MPNFRLASTAMAGVYPTAHFEFKAMPVDGGHGNVGGLRRALSKQFVPTRLLPYQRSRSGPSSTRVGMVASLAIAFAATIAAYGGADAALLSGLLPRNLTPPFFINATYSSSRCEGKYRCSLLSDDAEECSCHTYCYIHDTCCVDRREAASAAATPAASASASAAALRRVDPSLYTCADAALLTAGRTVTVDDAFNVYVINRCPSGSAFAAGSALSTLCSNPLNQVWNDSVSAPVTHKVTGVTYRNVYCALCHGLDPKEVVAWSYQYACYDPTSPLPTESYYGILSRQGCLPGYQKPAATPPPHDCRPGAVQKCSDRSPLSAQLSAACSSGPTQYAYDVTRKVVYRNRECARCAATPPSEPLSCASWPLARFAAMPPAELTWYIAVGTNGGTSATDQSQPEQPVTPPSAQTPPPAYACPAALTASMSNEEQAAWLVLCPDLKLAAGRRRCVRGQRRK